MSDALEVIEGLAAGAAAVVRLAGCRAEFAYALAGAAAAARASHHRRMPQAARARDLFLGRRDAKCPQLAAPLNAQPRARPGWREHLLHNRLRVTARNQRRTHRLTNHLGRGTTGIGRRDPNVKAPVGFAAHVPDDT